MVAVSEVNLFSEPRCANVDFDAVTSYLRRTIGGAEVKLRGPFFEDEHARDSEDAGSGSRSLPEGIAAARVRDVAARVEPGQRVLPGEVDYEVRRLENRDSGVHGILYDAELLSQAASGRLGRFQAGLGKVNIIATNQLIGTWSSADNRYHARTVWCGAPAIVSLPGLVKAPARDRRYYVARRGAAMMGLSEQHEEELAEEYAGDYLRDDDERITEILKGYVLQPVAYRITGEAFCDDTSCRLFNAHWQKDMLTAQLEGDDLCERHHGLLGANNGRG